MAACPQIFREYSTSVLNIRWIFRRCNKAFRQNESVKPPLFCAFWLQANANSYNVLGLLYHIFIKACRVRIHFVLRAKSTEQSTEQKNSGTFCKVQRTGMGVAKTQNYTNPHGAFGCQNHKPLTATQTILLHTPKNFITAHLPESKMKRTPFIIHLLRTKLQGMKPSF